MPESRHIVRVFLASPGDVPEERQTAKSVVDEFNHQWAEELGHHVELVGWEDTITASGRPQAIINREVARCDLFVGILWRRWGTPTGKYSSGFEEEFSISKERRVATGRPEVGLFFKSVAADVLRDPGPDLKKVLAFKDGLVGERGLLFQQFQDIRDFERKFRDRITSFVLLMKNQARAVTPEGVETPTKEGERSGVEGHPKPLSDKGAEFLRGFLERTKASGSGHIGAPDVARFRLLATLVGEQGNDHAELGAHDANLLFASRDTFTWGDREKWGLVAAGLRYFPIGNVPLWHWIASLNGFERPLLQAYALTGSANERVGALAAMSMFGEPIVPLESASRDAVVGDLLATTDSRVLDSVLQYLGACGTDADSRTVRAKGDLTARPAVDALTRISLRNSKESALGVLCELQPVSVSAELVREIFSGNGLSPDLLVKAVGHASGSVRAGAATCLRTSGRLSIELARQLLADDDGDVRFQALISLLDLGAGLTLEQAKEKLVETSTILGGFPGYDAAGEARFTRYRSQYLRSLPDEALQSMVSTAQAFDQEPLQVLATRHFERYALQIRVAVDDEYRTVFDQKLRTLATEYGENVVSGWRPLESSVKGALLRGGLDVLCHASREEDLNRVRSVLRKGNVSYSSLDVEYLRDHGEWSDLALISAAVQRPAGGARRGLLADVEADDRFTLAASALLKLGGSRIPELLTQALPERLLRAVIRQLPGSAVRGLGDHEIQGLLQSETESIRKVTALRCVEVLPKRRLRGLLKAHLSGTPYYYNVVHWLDFGLSAPGPRAVKSARRMLREPVG